MWDRCTRHFENRIGPTAFAVRPLASCPTGRAGRVESIDLPRNQPKGLKK
jgi:hypothetical protein